jgi:hypothetical protein
VVLSLASAWHKGWKLNLEDVENLTDEPRDAIDGGECSRQAAAAAERHRGSGSPAAF